MLPNMILPDRKINKNKIYSKNDSTPLKLDSSDNLPEIKNNLALQADNRRELIVDSKCEQSGRRRGYED